MELGAEISQRVKKTIKKQLQTLGSYVDDELPEYIMVMIANKRTKEQMVEDLTLFLNDEAEKFVSWLLLVLGRIEEAMKLPDIDNIGDEENTHESRKKSKKGKKERKISDSDSNLKKSDKIDDIIKKKKMEERRRSKELREKELREKEQREKELREKELKEKEMEEKERERRKQERLARHKEKAREAERERKQRMEEHLKREREREEINKRRAAREKREKDLKEKRLREEHEKREREELEDKKRREREREELEEKKRREKERKYKEAKKKLPDRRSEDKSRQGKEIEENGLDDENQKDGDVVRKEAEHEAKRIENRGSRNPMEFVKQIAKDINEQLLTNVPTDAVKKVENDKTKKVSKNDSGLKKNEGEDSKLVSNGNKKLTMSENVSLQAVSQYEDGENDVEKGDHKGSQKSKKHKHQRRESANRSASSSPPRSGTRHHNRRNSSSRNRSSRSRSRERGRRHRSKSRSRSKEKQEKNSRREHVSHSSSSSKRVDAHHSKARNNEDSNDPSRRRGTKDYSKRKDDKSDSPRRRNSHGTVGRRESNNDDKQRRESKNAVSDEDDKSKPSLSSEVKVYTDFKRKPISVKQHQPSSVLLKRAVTEVVKEKPEGDENGDDLELDYNESNDENEGSDGSSNEVSERRRVINFDKAQSGLTTITVNFNQDNIPDVDNEGKSQRTVRSNERDRKRMKTGDDRHSSSHLRKSLDEKSDHRKNLIPGISKSDARYTILRSRFEHESNAKEKKSHFEARQDKSSSREKHLSSMVADMEEKSKNRKRLSSWQEQRTSADSNKKRLPHRRGRQVNDHDSSGDDEKNNVQRLEELKKEAKIIEMKELSRSGNSEGDLRELLVGRRDNKSSSDDEDEIARKLREKMKEEKHKRLFGNLNPEEKERFKKERDSLREKLKSKKRKREKLNEHKACSEWIEKLPEKYIYKQESFKDTDVIHKFHMDLEEITDSDEESNNNIGKFISEEKCIEILEDEPEEIESKREIKIHKEIVNYETPPSLSGDEVDISERDKENQSCDPTVSNEEHRDVEEEVLDEADLDEADNNEGNEDEDDGCEEEIVEEEVEIEVEVSDNETLTDIVSGELAQGNATDKENKDSLNIARDHIEYEKNKNGDGIVQNSKNEDLSEEISSDVLKRSMHMESSDDSDILDGQVAESSSNAEKRNNDKYDRRSKQKTPKRKRARQEFIVTLDGVGDKSMSQESSSRERSPKDKRIQEKQKSDRHRKYKTRYSRSHSDEEFEEILRKKDKAEKRHSGSNRTNSDNKKSHRSRSHPSNSNDSKRGELSAVDREIMIAENKLKAQKLFKKSLEIVQNVTNNLEQRAIKSSFINPNFPNKLQSKDKSSVTIIPGKINSNASPALNHITPSPVLNQTVCPINSSISSSIIIPPTIVSSASEKLLVPSVHISVSKEDFILSSAAMDIVSLPHVDISAPNKNLIKPDIDNSDTSQGVSNGSSETLLSRETQLSEITADKENADVLTTSSSLVESETTASDSTKTVTSQAKSSIQERCAFWPECKNKSCPFIHPSINCKLFPNCSYGQRCIYIHPPCMFGADCSNPTCPFTHVATAPNVFSGFSQICKYYPNCTKVDCSFMHVAPKPCRYGSACVNPDCLFSHDKPPVSSSPLKWVAEKPHVSERKFAADDAIVAHLPVPIVTSQSCE